MSSPYNQHPLLERLLEANAKWAADVTYKHPNFFHESAKKQDPKVLWIGCSDSRVPESLVVATSLPGVIFTHRNIANQFRLKNEDSAHAVLDYTIDHLAVEHVIVVGHTGCGGVEAAYDFAVGQPKAGATIQRWLSDLTQLIKRDGFDKKPKEEALPLIVKANIKEQVLNITKTETIKHAWAAGKQVYVHGWSYNLENGRLTDLHVSEGPSKSKGASC